MDTKPYTKSKAGENQQKTTQTGGAEQAEPERNCSGSGTGAARCKTAVKHNMDTKPCTKSKAGATQQKTAQTGGAEQPEPERNWSGTGAELGRNVAKLQ
jgi:hypothetical protein